MNGVIIHLNAVILRLVLWRYDDNKKGKTCLFYFYQHIREQTLIIVRQNLQHASFFLVLFKSHRRRGVINIFFSLHYLLMCKYVVFIFCVSIERGV